MKYHTIWLIIGWFLIALVIYLSLTPQPPTPMTFNNADKIEHALAYAAMSFWLCQIYSSLRLRLWVIAALIGLGIALEYAQGWTGYRTFDVLDMLADGVGVLLGYFLVYTPLGRVLAHIDRRLAKY